MDWQKQMEQMIGQWADVQRTLWDQWVDTVRAFGQMPTDPDALRQEYERRMREWEASMNKALEAHQEWVNHWGADAPGALPRMPMDGARPWMEQMQAMFGEWTERQNGLWQTWFTALQSLDPAKAGAVVTPRDEALNEAWQVATDQARQALEQWATLAEQMASAMTGLAGSGAAAAAPEPPAADPEPEPAPVGETPKPAAKRVTKPRTRAPAAEPRPASASRRRAPRKAPSGSGDTPESTD